MWGIDAAKAATFDDSVKNGASLTGLGTTKEEVIFPANGCRADAILGEVIVDFEPTVTKIDAEFDPVGERVVDRLGQRAGWTIPPRLFEHGERSMQALIDGPALPGPNRARLTGPALVSRSSLSMR